MGTKTTYHPLFEVDLFHGYYLHPNSREHGLSNVFSGLQRQDFISADQAKAYNIQDDISIGLAKSSVEVMNNYKMVFRTTPRGFIVLIKVAVNGQEALHPFIPFNNAFKLLVFLQIRNIDFLNFTETDTSLNKESIYHFSNSINQEINDNDQGTLYLGQPSENELEYGYASIRDQMLRISPKHTEYVENLNLSQVDFKLENEFLSHTQRVVKSPNENKIRLAKLDFSHLPSGKYTLRAFSTLGNEKWSKSVFLQKGDLPRNTYAVFEILHIPTMESESVSNAYRLLKDNGSLNSPKYQLWWKNRKTRCRYLFDVAQPNPDEACDLVFGQEFGEITPSNKILVTKPGEDVPLSSGYFPISYKKKNSGTPSMINDPIWMPNPSPARLFPEGEEVYSEVVMGNIKLT